MKKLVFTIFFFLFPTSIVLSQSWQELDSLAMDCYNRGDYKTALIYVEKEVTQKETEFGKIDSNYIGSFCFLAYLHYCVGQYDKAEQLYMKALQICKEVLGEKSTLYAESLKNLPQLYDDMGLYDKAEPLYKEALKIQKEVLGEKNRFYSESLNILAILYYHMGQYYKAEPLLKEAYKIRKEVFGEKNDEYTESLNDLGFFYNVMGQYDKSELFLLEALKIRKEIHGKKHPDYAMTLNNLAYLYDNMGLYDKAESLYNEVLKIKKEVLGENHPVYAKSLNYLAGLYKNMRLYDKSELLYKEVLKIRKEVLGEKHPDYAKSLNNLATLYYAMGKYDKAEPLFLTALKIQKEVLGDIHFDYAGTLRNLGDLYRNTKQFDKAEPMLKEALQIFTETLGEKHPKFTDALISLALLYDAVMKPEKAEKYFINANKNYLSQIDSYFSSFSEKEKFQFIDKLNENFEIFYSFCLRRYSLNNSLTSDMFALRIPSKGNILASTSQLRERIHKSGDEELNELYDKLQTKKAEISKASSLTLEERQKRGLDLIALENEANELEKELSTKSEVYRNEFEPKKINWLSVKRSLKVDESAVEFLNFRYYDNRWTDTVYYVALVIRPEFEYPKLVKLCTEKQLSNILNASAESVESYIKNKEKSTKLFELIWKPMEEQLKGVNKVFISPSGLINKISFSAISTSDEKLLCDKYSFNYTGNLKEIALNKEKENNIKDIEGFSAAIFGGAKYDIDTTTEKDIASKFTRGGEDEWSPPANMILQNISITKLSKWKYLPGTLIEADKIKLLFESHSLKVNEYTGEDASKEALKSLNYKNSPTVLHISTHGYFFPEPQKEYKETGTSTYITSENPLFRSGLILAGANRVWTGASEIEGVENGILTAYEVSNMDLQNTELVVLSACETGLGDIKGGEGVYGLQRAFKIAGAKTIIMSLWKVPDKETVELMELFYTNWLEKKMTKHDAFTNAQKEMRKKYAPYYWAAFVMVE